MRNAECTPHIEIFQTDLPSEALILKKPGADKEAANAEKKDRRRRSRSSETNWLPRGQTNRLNRDRGSPRRLLWPVSHRETANRRGCFSSRLRPELWARIIHSKRIARKHPR